MKLHLLLASTLVLPAALKAQDSTVPAPQARVRVTTDAGRFVGRWLGRTADSLSIAGARNEPMGFAAASVRNLEISAGRKRRTGSGAVIGLATGLVGGLVTAAVLCNDGCGDLHGFVLVVVAGLGAGGGLLIGAIIGSQIRSERWEPVPLNVGLSLSLP